MDQLKDQQMCRDVFNFFLMEVPIIYKPVIEPFYEHSYRLRVVMLLEVHLSSIKFSHRNKYHVIFAELQKVLIIPNLRK